MRHPLSWRQIVGAVAIMAALTWGSGMVASSLAQTQPLRAQLHPARGIDYATDTVAPGSPFFTTRAPFDQ
jgi:anti-sigma-K factor RskA